MNQPAVARRVVLSGLWLWLRLTSPSDSARLPPGQAAWSRDGVVVTPLVAEPGGLRQGDVVIAAGGRSLESWAEALFRSGASIPQLHFGQTVTYTVLRGGHLRDVSIRLGHYPLGALVQDEWGFLAFTLVFALVGAYVLVRRPNDRAARTLFQSAWSMLVAVPWVFGLQVSDLFGGPSFWLYQAIVLGGVHPLLDLFAALHTGLPRSAPAHRRAPLDSSAALRRAVCVLSRLSCSSAIRSAEHPELDRAVGARRIGAWASLRDACGRRDEPGLPGKS